MAKSRGPISPVERYYRRKYWQVRGVLLAIVIVLGFLVYWGIFADIPEDYSSTDEHFKYGSIGSDRENGLPYWIWRVLPEVFPERLPYPNAFQALPEDAQTGLAAYEQQFGFLFEAGKERPIGFSRRRVLVDRVGLNCAVCHVGAVRATEGMKPRQIYGGKPDYATHPGGSSASTGERVLVLGMPSQTVDLGAYFQFLFDAAQDGRFTVNNIMAQIEAKTDLSPWRAFFYRRAIPRVRENLLSRRRALSFIEDTPAFGPGRVDTFNPYKAVQFGFPVDETIGTADFPSIWNQGPRVGMKLHWDGNNKSVFERNISAALGAGATPVGLDMPRMLRVASWIGAPDPKKPIPQAAKQAATEAPFPEEDELAIPKYPFDVDSELVKQGKELFHNRELAGGKTCATCHGWQGEDVGEIVPIEKIGTDPERLQSFTEELVNNQNTLGAGQWWRFSHFRKTHGYANMPLDGIWARAPYLHDGAVPTLRDLLNPPLSSEEAEKLGFQSDASHRGMTQEAVAEMIKEARKMGRRPPVFYRGDDRYDPQRAGFVANRATSADGRPLFLFDTSLPGNGNEGHLYGTQLSEQEKRALVEYMKTIGPNPARDDGYE